MKKALIIILPFFIFSQCKTFHVTTEIKNRSQLKKYKNSGIMFRIPNSSAITVQHIEKNLSYWFVGYKKLNNIKIIKNTSEELNIAKNEYDRFQQTSEDDDFHKYKVIGQVTQYLQDNDEELKKIISENSLDSLIIVEVDGLTSPEMEFIDFGSMVIIVSPEYEISYMDHQSDNYDNFESQDEIMKNHLVDKLCQRIIKILYKLDYIDKKK